VSQLAPLHGKRIVVTRNLDQARELKDRLEALGATVLLLPAVSFTQPVDLAPLDRAIAILPQFDWLLFTSANAVRFFARRCRDIQAPIAKQLHAKIGAVGPVTAAAAAGEGFEVTYVARQSSGKGLAQELGAAVAGTHILLPRSDLASRELPQALAAMGAHVTEVVAYNTQRAAATEGTPEAEDWNAIRHAGADVVSFFSPSSVYNVREELGADAFARLAQRAAFATVGPVTSAALRDLGLAPAIEAAATTGSMVDAIVRYFTESSEVPAQRS
jgi:uroporphyrinogen-III synthase